MNTTIIGYVVNAKTGPCKLGIHECKHKHETCGKCRETCIDYQAYEDLKVKRKALIDSKKEMNGVMYSYLKEKRG